MPKGRDPKPEDFELPVENLAEIKRTSQKTVHRRRNHSWIATLLPWTLVGVLIVAVAIHLIWLNQQIAKLGERIGRSPDDLAPIVSRIDLLEKNDGKMLSSIEGLDRASNTQAEINRELLKLKSEEIGIATFPVAFDFNQGQLGRLFKDSDGVWIARAARGRRSTYLYDIGFGAEVLNVGIIPTENLALLKYFSELNARSANVNKVEITCSITSDAPGFGEVTRLVGSVWVVYRRNQNDDVKAKK